MSAEVYPGRQGRMVIHIEGLASANAGAIGEIANPEGVDLFITRSMLFVTKNSDGAANLSCGVAASGGAFTDIINALAMGAAEGKLYNASTFQPTTKTEVTVPAKWTTTTVLGFTGSASTVGLVADLYVEYLVPTRDEVI